MLRRLVQKRKKKKELELEEVKEIEEAKKIAWEIRHAEEYMRLWNRGLREQAYDRQEKKNVLRRAKRKKFLEDGKKWVIEELKRQKKFKYERAIEYRKSKYETMEQSWYDADEYDWELLDRWESTIDYYEEEERIEKDRIGYEAFLAYPEKVIAGREEE
jgi:hypothetical protein